MFGAFRAFGTLAAMKRSAVTSKKSHIVALAEKGSARIGARNMKVQGGFQEKIRALLSEVIDRCAARRAAGSYGFFPWDIRSHADQY
jgi:hypothetical protein